MILVNHDKYLFWYNYYSKSKNNRKLAFSLNILNIIKVLLFYITDLN